MTEANFIDEKQKFLEALRNTTTDTNIVSNNDHDDTASQTYAPLRASSLPLLQTLYEKDPFAASTVDLLIEKTDSVVTGDEPDVEVTSSVDYKTRGESATSPLTRSLTFRQSN